MTVPTATTAGTQSRIVWPRAALAGCVFCMIVRDTRGVPLSDLERFNFFPASPLCCLSWLVDGGLHLIGHPDHMQRPQTAPTMPRFAFSGAQLGPLVSWNPGEIYAITLAFYPDAFAALTGLDLSLYAGRALPADDVLPPALRAQCQAFSDTVQSDGINRATATLERALEAQWAQARPEKSRPVHWLADWSRSLVARAALAAPGRSARQIARRVRSLTGVSARDLNTLAHTEQLYAKLHAALQAGTLDWAELAADTGFSDQAHMIRRLRQHTGFTPEQLRERAQNHEAFWPYRLLGAYFSMPAER